MTIDHEGDTPVYRQIAGIIAERIKAGTLQPRRPIPSETTLVQEFGVARETARRAVAYLREQGLVYTVPQRGTYVTGPDSEPPADQ
jgi:GntR family transcriptional regulator